MKQTLAIGTLVLLATLTEGCGNESGRMADMAEGMVHSQNEVNSNITRTNEKFVELNHELHRERTELQVERISLNDQFQRLEQDRRDRHSERQTELVWAEAFQFLAIIIAATMPLFLCAYLIWAATRSSVDQEEVNTVLIHELVSAEPRLIAGPNLRSLEQVQEDEQRQPVDETRT